MGVHVPLAFAANSQKDIHEVEHRMPRDAAAFEEIAEVLRRHGLDGKYGVTLLHKHFDLEDDEVLVEFTDIEQRTLVSKPVKVDSDDARSAVEVTWDVSEDATMGVCRGRCFVNYNATPPHKWEHVIE